MLIIITVVLNNIIHRYNIIRIKIEKRALLYNYYIVHASTERIINRRDDEILKLMSSRHIVLIRFLIFFFSRYYFLYL